DAHGLALADIEAHVAHRPELAEIIPCGPAHRTLHARQDHLLQPVCGLRVKFVALGQTLDANAEIFTRHRRSPCASVRTRQTRTTRTAMRPQRRRRDDPNAEAGP